MDLFVLFVALLACMLEACSANVKLRKVSGEIIEGSYIVSLTTAKNVHFYKETYNASATFELPGFAGFAAELNQLQLGKLMDSDEVRYIEPDQMARAFTLSDGSCPNVIPSIFETAEPSWGLKRLTVDSWLQIQKYTHNREWGDGINVYVLDTGTMCAHEEFAKCECGPSFWGGAGNGCSDGNGHGTHCSSTVAGVLHGVAKSATITGVRVLDSNGAGPYSSVIEAIDFVVHNAGPRAVISMSLGGGKSDGMNEAVNAAVKSGVAVTVAAGNDRTNACNISPASAEGAITVGATDAMDVLAQFSNWGTCVDIHAPGTDIIGAWNGATWQYRTASGTSMSAPHVSGIVAALLSLDESLEASDVKDVLMDMALKGIIVGLPNGSPNELVHFACDAAIEEGQR